jgi:hypothetical protein
MRTTTPKPDARRFSLSLLNERSPFLNTQLVSIPWPTLVTLSVGGIVIVFFFCTIFYSSKISTTGIPVWVAAYSFCRYVAPCVAPVDTFDCLGINLANVSSTLGHCQ